MAAKSGDLGDRMSGANLQMEGHANMPSQGTEDQQELEASGSSPSHWLSWSLARRLPSDCPNTRYFLEIHVTLTKELGAVSSLSHSWMAPLVEDMLHDIRTGLTKAVVTGPGRAVLFYGRHSLGEGLTMYKARDATFLLTGVGTWVGKPAYLTADSMTIQEGQQMIDQAIMDCWVKVRGPGHPHVNPLTQQPFRFDCTGGLPLKNTPGEVDSDHRPLPHWPPRGWDHNRYWRDRRPPPSWLPLPSPDHGFESNRSSLSPTLLMSSRLDGSERSQCSRHGRQHWEDGAHMKINLPVFKDEDAKDVVTYQIWRWDLTMYQHVGCRDCTLLPYAIWSLQRYPGELVQSSSIDITLDDMLTILDKYYNNVKILDTLNQELFQLRMADKETFGLGWPSLKMSLGFSCFFPWPFSPWLSTRVEESNDPGGIEGVTKEFMVCLARAVKDAQVKEKHCYHCSSPEHFIHNCPLIKTLRENAQLNGKEGMASKKGAQTPPAMVSTPKNLQMEVLKV